METNLNMTQMLELADKDFKTANIYIQGQYGLNYVHMGNHIRDVENIILKGEILKVQNMKKSLDWLDSILKVMEKQD